MEKGRKEGELCYKVHFFCLTFQGEHKSISKYIHIPKSGDLTEK